MSKFRAAPKWRKESPTRTNTGSSAIRGKISHPIPFADDDEFPIRSPGSNLATPLGPDTLEKHLQRGSSAVSSMPRPVTPPPRTTSIDFERMAERATPTPPQLSQSPPNLPTNGSPRALQSATSNRPSAISSGKPQRKKSSLRSVFGRLFGGKKKNSHPLTPIPQDRSGQHRSDPSALHRNRDNALTQQRSASLPVNEFSRALRSHSTVIDEFPTMETEEDEEKRESIPSNAQPRARRATTPSRLWTPNKTPGYVDWTGLSPRPASSHARDSRLIGEDDDQTPIGVAVTSGSHPNRRSRSVGELRGSLPEKLLARRRSDEIRYWRESYDPGMLSPMSSNKPEVDETVLVDEPEALQKDEEQPPQPFNFGTMGEMAGMKITQAASLESRVQQMEAKVVDLEKVVSRLLTRSTNEPLVFQDPPRRASYRGRSHSGNRPRTDESELSLPNNQMYRGVQQTHPMHPSNQFRSSSYGSTRPSTTSTSNSYMPSAENTSHPFPSALDHTDAVQQTARPLSTSTTIRGIPSSSPTHPPKDGLTIEHYNALMNMVVAEQTARQNLEGIVRHLQQQLHTVLTAKPASYPTPVSDHAVRDFSTFEQDDDCVSDGERFDEDFRTPNEERTQFSDEIFGHGDEKNGNRTLSLSQMTLKRGVDVGF